jgi:hypothetical protein
MINYFPLNKLYYFYFILEIQQMTKKSTTEEKKGSKVIQWTPFPIPPKNLIDYSKIETASQKMTAAKIFPVI